MRSAVLVVPGRLPGLNELMLSRHQRTGVKKKWCQTVAFWARASKLDSWPSGAHMHLELFEPNKRRDPSNAYAGAVKIIEDALVQCGVLPGDSWKYMLSPGSFEWSLDKDNPRVIVHLSSEPLFARRSA